jgi:hypothetical protein
MCTVLCRCSTRGIYQVRELSIRYRTALLLREKFSGTVVLPVVRKFRQFFHHRYSL